MDIHVSEGFVNIEFKHNLLKPKLVEAEWKGEPFVFVHPPFMKGSIFATVPKLKVQYEKSMGGYEMPPDVIINVVVFHDDPFYLVIVVENQIYVYKSYEELPIKKKLER